MATSQHHISPSGPQGDDDHPAPAPASPAVGTQAVDDLLDEIDDVLETNAESFVRGFVQKGGQ